MKRQIASILIVTALVVGAGIGYFGHTPATSTITETIMSTYTESNTTTETAISTYTLTTTLPQGTNTTAFPQGLSMRCILTEYHVWMIASIGNTTTSYGTSTQSYDVQTYQTTTSITQAVGSVTTTTANYNGTLTGALAIWNSTVCTYISG